jgi:ABC-2 type transport system permease protein
VTFATVVGTELQKLRRTRIPWVLALIYGLAPLMLGLMMAVLRNPELGRRLGLLTTKAQLTIGVADWRTYLMLTGFLFAGGLIVLSIEQAFLFGREYAEGTAKNMLTLPIPRSAFIAAKLTLSVVWFVAVATALFGEAVAIGFIIGLPGYRPELLAATALQAARLTAQVLLLSTVPAWITIATRGYLAPVGLSILLLLVGDLFSHTGWGPWVPWAIVFLQADAAGPEAPLPGVGSWFVLCVTALAGAVAAWASLDRTDNTQ